MKLRDRLRAAWSAFRWPASVICDWCGLPEMDAVHRCDHADRNHPARLTCHRPEEAR